MAKRKRRSVRIGNCNYHLCGKRTKLFRCKYCGKYFCKEHLRAKPPGMPVFELSTKEDVRKMMEYRKPGGHPCPDYLEQWEWEQELKRRKYSDALERLIISPKKRRVKPIWHPKPPKPVKTHVKPFFLRRRRERIKKAIIALIIIGIVGYFLYEGLQSGKIQTIFQNATESIGTWWTESDIDEGIESIYTDYGTNWGCSVIQVEYNYRSSEEDSKAAIEYINNIRKQNGKKEISFDKRVFELAVARAKDMREYNYLDHTNPETGKCPDNMKSDYGLKSYEYVAENCFGNPEYSEGTCTEIEIKPMTDAIDSWVESRGHRYNLLYSNHKAGAVGCYKNMCVFLGLNNDEFGKGCHRAAEGEEFWEEASKQPGEVV